MQHSLSSDLLASHTLAYESSRLIMKNVQKESESQDYGACVFQLNGRSIKFRTAKITPKKIGQFVTLWKRIGKGPMLPCELADPIDLYIVSVRAPDQFGQFFFPKAVLCDKGILSKKDKEESEQ